jgi:hypothetical protein
MQMELVIAAFLVPGLTTVATVPTATGNAAFFQPLRLHILQRRVGFSSDYFYGFRACDHCWQRTVDRARA